MERLKKLVLLTTNNQVAIPVFVVRSLKLRKGSYLEVEEKGRQIIMTPKELVNQEDFHLYQDVIKKGREQYKKGETVDWEDVKKKATRQN